MSESRKMLHRRSTYPGKLGAFLCCTPTCLRHAAGHKRSKWASPCEMAQSCAILASERWLCLIRFFAAAVLWTFGSPPLHAQGPAQPGPSASLVAGWIERVSLPGHNLTYEGKLDTGADSSSINASDVEVVTRANDRLVRFSIFDDTGKSTRMELPHVRWVRIRRTGGGHDRRPVTRLKVCLGGINLESEFTIADRETLDYQILIGRKVLAGRLLVDAGRKHLLPDRCAATQ